MNGFGLTSEQVLRALEQGGLRRTTARRAVVDAVVDSAHSFTGADILARVAGSDRTVGRATVFRTLDVLVDLGMISRIQQPDGGRSYVLCSLDHHHHAICSRCGLVVELPGCGLDPNMEKEAQSAGFRLQGHRLEFYGVCWNCQEKGNA